MESDGEGRWQEKVDPLLMRAPEPAATRHSSCSDFVEFRHRVRILAPIRAILGFSQIIKGFL